MISKAPRGPGRPWHRRARGALLTLFVCLAGTAPALSADTIVSAKFTEPTTRYPHAVLGDAIEYGALELIVSDETSAQSKRTVRLPSDRVFEDLEPRLADVDGDRSPEVVVVESQAQTGAQLAIYDARGAKIAATPHIGTRNRWLAPIGIADLDGDGYIEIAYIDRPHLAKTLRIWRYKNGNLIEIATLPGLTNHQIGEDFISGGLRDCNDHPELIVASADWSRIIRVSYNEGWQTTDLGPLRHRTDLTAALNC